MSQKIDEPYHPTAEGKIKRYLWSKKKVVNLGKHNLPWELEESAAQFTEYCNDERIHESTSNVTLTDVLFGGHLAPRQTESGLVIIQRGEIRKTAFKQRKQYNLTHK